MKLATMMKKAIDYFEQNKPEGASIRGCEPWEFTEGKNASALIRITYAKRNELDEMDYSESDKHPWTVHLFHFNGELYITKE